MAEKRPYSWYRHHAWGGLAILSVLFAVHGMVGLPEVVTFPLAGVILVYVVVALFFTYRSSADLRKESAVGVSSPGKGQQKLEKKKGKAEAKLRKKQEKKG